MNEVAKTVDDWQQHLDVINAVLAGPNVADDARRCNLVYPPSLPDDEVVELTRRAKERAENRIAALVGVGHV